MISKRALTTSILAAGLLAGGPAPAQNYPSRPIAMLVPFPPCGATDDIPAWARSAILPACWSPRSWA